VDLRSRTSLYLLVGLLVTACLAMGCPSKPSRSRNGGSNGDNNPVNCNPDYDFEGGSMDIATLTIDSAALSDECDATPEMEDFLINLVTWLMSPPAPHNPPGLGWLEYVYIPGYPELDAGASADLILLVVIPLAPPRRIVFEIPMVCSDNDIMSQQETFIDEDLQYLVFDCRMTTYASGIVTPTSDTTANAVIDLRELTLSGPACLPFTPQPGCTITLGVHGTLE
jgi:hypothetical protein